MDGFGRRSHDHDWIWKFIISALDPGHGRSSALTPDLATKMGWSGGLSPPPPETWRTYFSVYWSCFGIWRWDEVKVGCNLKWFRLLVIPRLSRIVLLSPSGIHRRWALIDVMKLLQTDWRKLDWLNKVDWFGVTSMEWREECNSYNDMYCFGFATGWDCR